MTSTTQGSFHRVAFGGRSIVLVGGGVAVKQVATRRGTNFVLRREASALARCRTSALPRLLGWSETSSTIRMTGFEGPNLEEYVSVQGPLPKRTVASILSTIGSALRHLHATGLFHLDVKPRNVVIERHGGAVCARLVDLGSCAGPALPLPELNEETRLRRLGGGAFRHCCPDQLFQRFEALGEHWDAFGLGATAFYALSGRWPADNDTVRAATVARHYRLLNRYPAYEPLTETIRSLLDADPATAARILQKLGTANL